MKLTADMVAMLKKWNDNYPMLLAEYDSTFLLHFMDAVFGRETLSRSSAYGKSSNNGGKAHEPLNPARLKFIKGVFLELICVYVFFLFFFFIV